MTTCQCPAAGYCSTHKRQMNETMWTQCQTQLGFFEALQKPRGLGDTVKKFTDATGISKLVGDCGGCQKRQEKLNEMFPYQ